ncbi:MAG TPA: hypothetical protein VER39_00865 [Nocardioidaceae bacterium]|nr:hypothetical protein [Nocardioidaceae bacterium]
MTSPDDGQRDDLPQGTPQGPGEPADVPLDEDAAWRAIVANYGDRASLDGTVADPPTPTPAAPDEGPTVDAPSGGVDAPPAPTPFDRSYLDAVDARRTSDRQPAESGDDQWPEEHFVPPEPPPVPRGTPARRLAWAGLFAPPLLMILAVVLRWTPPALLTMALVAAFVGGFVYLVCTMPRDGGDGWGDGAVV